MPRVFLGQFPQNVEMKYTAVLQDENGVAIPASSLTTLTLTIYTLPTPPTVPTTVVNAIDHVNILNVGRGTVDALGNLTILLAPADMALVNPALVQEEHVMLIEWTYNAGARGGNHEVQFTVQPVVRV